MSDQRGRTRILLGTGTTYCAVESITEVEAMLTSEADLLTFTSVMGVEIFPPERIVIRRSEIISIQEITEEAWVWVKMANERHYKAQITATPAEDMAQAQRELVEALKGDA